MYIVIQLVYEILFDFEYILQLFTNILSEYRLNP